MVDRNRQLIEHIEEFKATKALLDGEIEENLQSLEQKLVDEAFPLPSYGETEPKNMTAEERYEHRRDKTREANA